MVTNWTQYIQLLVKHAVNQVYYVIIRIFQLTFKESLKNIIFEIEIFSGNILFMPYKADKEHENYNKEISFF